MANPETPAETLPATPKTLLLKKVELLRWREEEIEHLQVDRSLIEEDDRNFIFQCPRELPNEAGFEPIEFLQRSLAVVLERHSQVRDALWLVDVSKGRNRRRDPKSFVNKFHSFPECKMFVFDEKLLATNCWDLLRTEPPTPIFGLHLLERDCFDYSSSLVLGQELPDGTLRSMDHGRDLTNRIALITKPQDFLLRVSQHSLEHPWLGRLLLPLELDLGLRLRQEPEIILESAISSFRIQPIREPISLQRALLHQVADNFEIVIENCKDLRDEEAR